MFESAGVAGMIRRFLVMAFVVAAVGVGVWIWSDFRLSNFGPTLLPVIPANQTVLTKTADSVNSTGIPLKISAGFQISIFAKKLSGPRVLMFDSQNRLLVSLTGSGTVVRLSDLDQDGSSDRQETIITGLHNPHGLVFWQGKLVIAEERWVVSYDYSKDGQLSPDSDIITQLPGSGGHFTRTLGVGPDGNLYISIGSSCNVCHESDKRRAAIMVVAPGSSLRVFANGLRNSVFFAWHPITRQLWATDNGRDMLGDQLPPDEINIVEDGGFYGWPYCYGQNIWDQEFDKSAQSREICARALPDHIDLPAHSAALGMAFVQGDAGWPEEYRHDLLVAYHGSWNSSQPTGYKIVRVKLDERGKYLGLEDFISGWLPEGKSAGQAYGRPVSLLFGPDGKLYISDDKAGVIYLVNIIRK